MAATRRGTKTAMYTNRSQLLVATRAECAGIYQELFGRALAPTEVASWQAWLKRSNQIDAAALRAAAALKSGLDAVVGFCDSHEPQRHEHRAGIRAEHVIGPKTVQVSLYVDAPTLPPSAPPQLAQLAPSVPLAQNTIRAAVIPVEYDYELEWQPNASPDESAPPSPSLPLVLSTRSTVDTTATAILVRSLRRKVDDLARDIAVIGGRKKPPGWETRLAVVARWDRSYSPGELRKRRKRKAPPDRLTPAELAAISILYGNVPSVSKPLTVPRAIDAEARYIAHALKSLAKRQTQGVPVPRRFA